MLDPTSLKSRPSLPKSIPNTGVTLQRSERSTDIPPTTVSDPESDPVVMPSPPSGVIPAELPLSVESAHIQPNNLSRPQGSLLSTLTTASSHITPQFTPVLGDHGTTSVGTLSAWEHEETRDLNRPTPVEVSLHVQHSGPSALHIAQIALPPGDDQHDQKEQ
jgi:hypothetical protein